MTQTKNNILKRIFYGLSVMALLLMYHPPIASAATITPRKVTIGSSVASAVTTYSFAFTVPSATVIKSASFVPCTTASGACTMPPGFSGTGALLSSQPTNLGDASGWVTTDSTATELRLSKSGNVAAPAASITVAFSGATNPSATNSTFFVRMNTFSAANWTSPIDTGTVATSTAGQVTINASVDETLTFTMTSQTVNLPTLTTSSTGTGTSTMTAATNAASGYTITVAGTTLTSGGNTITALGSPTASATNNKQFGLNLMANSTPSVGTAVSGAGSGLPAANYNTINSYKFVSGDTVASASLPTNSNTFTTSYIANIDGATAPGAYQTILTYVATANF
jgi:hypothetical protein